MAVDGTVDRHDAVRPRIDVVVNSRLVSISRLPRFEVNCYFSECHEVDIVWVDVSCQKTGLRSLYRSISSASVQRNDAHARDHFLSDHIRGSADASRSRHRPELAESLDPSS